MVLSVINPKVLDVEYEYYFSKSIERGNKNHGVNPVMGKIEELLRDVCQFSEPRLSRGRRRVVDYSRPFYKDCFAKMDSDGVPVTISVHGKYENPGAKFTGEVDLTLAYGAGVNDGDLVKVREAIVGSGLRKC